MNDLPKLRFDDFEMSARAVLAYLQRHLNFDLWMLARTEGNDWVVLQTQGAGFDVGAGTVLPWTDTFCYQMVNGAGPRVAPQADRVPAYAASPLRRRNNVKAYIGIPLVRENGELFGTLCGVHSAERTSSIVREQALVELLGGMLNTILQQELKAAENARRVERLKMEALTDALTNVYNRRGWEHLLRAEEDRCRRYGHPAAVLVIDLNGLKQVNDTQGHAAGDQLIARAARALTSAARSSDIVARLGGDEFGILAVECDRFGAEALLTRAQAALAAESVSAAIGLAMRTPARSLIDTWEAADQCMYDQKRAAKTLPLAKPLALVC